MRAAIGLLLFAASAAAASPVPDPAAVGPDPVQKAARPVADPPGGPFSGSLRVALSDPSPGVALLYTLDGTDPDTAARAATRLYDGPLDLAATTVLKARAVKPGWNPSEVMIESYTLMPPLYGLRGWFLDEDGDGRVEKAVVVFSLELPALPDRLAFTLDHDDSDSAERIATGPELAFSAGHRDRVEARFGEPFPFAWTSSPIQGTTARIFAQADPPLMDQTVPLYDSAAPVAVRAFAHPAEAGADYAQVELSLSEPTRTISSYLQAILWKRPDGTSGYLPLVRPAVANASGTDLRLATEPGGTPLPGDSLALVDDGRLTDLYSNAPRHLHWIGVEAGGPAALVPAHKAQRRRITTQIRRYHRGKSEFDAKGAALADGAIRPDGAALP